MYQYRKFEPRWLPGGSRTILSSCNSRWSRPGRGLRACVSSQQVVFFVLLATGFGSIKAEENLFLVLFWGSNMCIYIYRVVSQWVWND